MAISAVWLRTGFAPILWCHPDIGAIRLHQPGLHVVGKVCHEDLIYNTSLQLCVFYRIEDFSAFLKISRHPIGAARVDFRIPAVMKVVDPGMFQEPVKDTDDANVLADFRYARPQAADASYNQVDADAGAGSFVQFADDLRVHEGVHLRDDTPSFFRSRRLDLPIDETKQRLLSRHRRDHELAEHGGLSVGSRQVSASTS